MCDNNCNNNCNQNCNVNCNHNSDNGCNEPPEHCNQNILIYDFLNNITSDDGVIRSKGNTGEKGSIGLKGEPGCCGKTGPVGCKGEKGMLGESGLKGEKGAQGNNLEISDSIELSDTLLASFASNPYAYVNNMGQKITKLYAIMYDSRSDKSEPNSISGNMTSNLLSYDGAFWNNLGPIMKNDSNTPNSSRSATSSSKGDKGEPGQRGMAGFPGGTGPQGVQGPEGDQGVQGIQGVRGYTGPAGLQGIKGDRGDNGIKGSTGETGASGDNIWHENWDLSSGENSVDYMPLTDNYVYFQGFWNNTSGQYKNIRFRLEQGFKTPTAGFLGDSKWIVGIYDNGAEPDLNTTGIPPWNSTDTGHNPWPRTKIAQGSTNAAILGLLSDAWIDIELDNEGIHLDRNKIYYVAIKQATDPNMSATAWNTTIYGKTKDTTKGSKINGLSWYREDNFDNDSSNWDSLPITSFNYGFGGQGPFIAPIHHDISFWFTLYGEQYNEGALKGPKGDKGIDGLKGDGSFGENLWYESWNMTFEKYTEKISMVKNEIYFQGFWNKTSGDYTNLKIRVTDSEVTNGLSGLNSVGNSKWIVGIYDNGAQDAMDNNDINSGFASWDTSNNGGISEPWPRSKLGEGIFGPGSSYNSDSLDNNLTKDNYWIDINFEQPIRLLRNKMYFVAIKQAVDPNMAASDWETKLYGILDTDNALETNMTWVRDNNHINWDELPVVSYKNISNNGNITTYSPTKTNKSIWFIVYGNQYAEGALKGEPGVDGKIIIESGAASLWHESWNLSNERSNNTINLENNNIYYQGFWNKTTGYYTNIKLRIGSSVKNNINGSFTNTIGNSKWIVGIYENGAQDAMDGVSNSTDLPPWNITSSALNQPWPDNKIAFGSINAAIIGEIDNNFIDISLDAPVLLKRNKIYYVAIKQSVDWNIRQSTTWQTSLYGSNDTENNLSYLTWKRDNSYGNTDASEWDKLPNFSYSTETLPNNSTMIHYPQKDYNNFWFVLYGDQYAEGVLEGPKGFTGDKGMKGESGTTFPNSTYMDYNDTVNILEKQTPKLKSYGEFRGIYFDSGDPGQSNEPYLVFECVDLNGVTKYLRVKVSSITESNKIDPYYNY